MKRNYLRMYRIAEMLKSLRKILKEMLISILMRNILERLKMNQL
jgi:hypothetical protein